jgi:hypothetical protein
MKQPSRDGVIRPLMTAFGEISRLTVTIVASTTRMSMTTPGNLTQKAEIIMHFLPKEWLSRQGCATAIGSLLMLVQERRKLLGRITHDHF